jgi:hypothetical protein
VRFRGCSKKRTRDTIPKDQADELIMCLVLFIRANFATLAQRASFFFSMISEHIFNGKPHFLMDIFGELRQLNTILFIIITILFKTTSSGLN